MPRPSRRVLLIVTIPLIAVVAAAAIWHVRPTPSAAAAADPPPMIGMVRSTEIRVAPEVGGRVARFLVAPGQAVSRGQPVAALTNPELWAALDAAKAEVDKARSDRDRVYAGVRDEQVQELQSEIVKAMAVHTQATQELARKTVLAARSDTSQQELNMAQAAEADAAADITIAEARYAEAKRGPTAEERALADAVVTAAEAARDVVEARAAKMLLHAPADGTVGILVAEPNEAVIPGQPVLTIISRDGAWLGFNVREDALDGLRIGSPVTVRTAGSDAPIPAKVTEIRDWGDFATWRAARASGDHDLNTFFVRVDPIRQASKLLPGATVWLMPAGGA